jgi:predicted transcriptional regulator
MSEADRVQRWRDAKRQQGLEPMTIWLSHEEKARLVAMAQRWHRSPSAIIREALAQFDSVSPRVTAAEADTEQLRMLIRDELTVSSVVTATVTDTMAATLPALVRQIVEGMALEALGLPVTATASDVTVAGESGKTPAVEDLAVSPTEPPPQRGGTSGGQYKLTPRQVASLRRKRARGTPIKSLMEEYGISRATLFRYLQ